MQVTELESSGLKKSFKVVVDAAQINMQMEAELKAAGERVKIPGFRPGFIPLKVLQQRYGKAVQPDVIKNTINRAANDVMAQKQIRPTMSPQVNIEEYEDGGDLTFTMSIESFPDVPEITFDDITLERKTFDIDEEEIDDAAERVSMRHPSFTPLEEGGKAKSGHIVNIDFKGMIDGVAFEGGTASDFKLELGSGQFIEGFEDQLIGAKKGDEKKVSVTFPKDYHAKNLAGQPAVFEVTINEIHSKEAPVIDDEFAKTLGFADIKAFRAALREQMAKGYEQIVRNDLKKQLFDELETKVDFELPQGMLEAEFNSIWARLQEAKKRGEADMEGMTEEELKKEYREIATRRVKLGLLLADIGRRNKIQVTREELGRSAMQYASMYPGQEKQILEFYGKHPERLEELRGPLLEEKAVDFILSKTTLKDNKVSLEELLKESEEDGVVRKKSTQSPKSKGEKSEKPATKKKKAAAE
jgi:trigger factor